MSEEKSKGRITVQLQASKVSSTGKIAYNQDGSIQSESQKLTLTYADLQWPEHLQNLPRQGFGKIEVVKLWQDGKELEDAELLDKIKQEVADFYKKPEAALTPEQQEIKELREKLEALANQVSPPKKVTTVEEPKAEAKNTTVDPAVALKAEYKELTGNDANGTWGERKLTEEINKAKIDKK